MDRDLGRSVAGPRSHLSRWTTTLFAGLVVLVVLGIGAVACGGDADTSPEQPTAPAATPSGSAPAETVGGIPIYEPSTVIREWNQGRTLTSPDPIEKVSAFYIDFVDREDWQIISKSVSHYSTNLTIKKSGNGANISIYPERTAPTGISISTYPTS